MADTFVKVEWDISTRDSEPCGKVFRGGRKLVKVDRKARIDPGLSPMPNTLQICRVLHDTKPGEHGYGVMFVIPTAPPVPIAQALKAIATEELAEVRAEWEASVHAIAAGEEGLRKMVGGFLFTTIAGYDSRWGKESPKNPTLRVVHGHAGIWSLNRNQTTREKEWGECLISLPELGEAMALARRLVGAWYPGSDFRSRADDLELEIENLERSAVVAEDGRRVTMTWTGKFTHQNTPVTGNGDIVGQVSVDVPSAECYIGDEDIPELTAANAAWVKKWLNGDEESSKKSRVCAGVLSVRYSTTPSSIGPSPDERSTREYGMQEVVEIFVDGESAGWLRREIWPKAKEHLGIKEGEVITITTRQIAAISCAYADIWRFGPIGPRGRAAFIAIAMGENSEFAAEMQQARELAGAKVAAKAKAEAEAREALRLQAEAEAKAKAEAAAAAKAKAAEEATELIRQQKAEGLFPDFEARHCAGGSTDCGEGWVVRSDGSLRAPDKQVGESRYGDATYCWTLVEKDELAITWTKAYTAAPHVFTVVKLPVNGLTDAQRETVASIVEKLADQWDGRSGFSGNTTSPPVGNGWGLTTRAPKAPVAPPAPAVAASTAPKLAAKMNAEEIRAFRKSLGLK